MSGRTFEDYLDDRMLRGAVERHIEIIGEAARNAAAAFRFEHPEIPWPQIIGQRNVLAHEYGDIEHRLLRRVATIHIPELIAMLEPLLPQSPPGD